MKTSTPELKDFVIHQAAEDAVLPPAERSHQKELVADVLGQEAQNEKVRSELLDLYHTETQVA
jgi:hypothetical protein